MKETAFVTEIKGEYAKVTVQRKSACSGCHKEGGCFETCKSSSAAIALNIVNAKKGDYVVVETAGRTVVLFAFIMYIIPIFLSIAAAAFAYVKTEKDLLAALTFIVFFGLYYLLLNPIVKKIKLSKNALKVIEIL